ncbi:MAG: class A beta-lactamase [Pseudomonadota bacterium]
MNIVSDLSFIQRLCRTLRSMTLGLLLSTTPSLADMSAEEVLGTTIHELETGLDARIGVLVRDSLSGWQWGHREDERFLMNSTFKSLLCGAVLSQVDRGKLTLDEPIPVRAEDILQYAPVTKEHVGATLSIGDLCLATLDLSDNTAANLLIDRLGGPSSIMTNLGIVGDSVTRIDRREPDLNTFTHGDPRDTTSPAAMLTTWDAMLLGDALEPESQAQLAEWMSHGGTTGAFLRASAPNNWQVVDKSGGGREYTRSVVAMVTPPGEAPYLVAIYVSDTPADWAMRNAAVAEIGAAVIEVMKAR